MTMEKDSMSIHRVPKPGWDRNWKIHVREPRVLHVSGFYLDFYPDPGKELRPGGPTVPGKSIHSYIQPLNLNIIGIPGIPHDMPKSIYHTLMRQGMEVWKQRLLDQALKSGKIALETTSAELTKH